MSIKKRLKTVFIEEDIKIKELAEKLSEARNKMVPANTISQQINKETMRFNEVEEILDILGYDIEFKKRHQKSGS